MSTPMLAAMVLAGIAGHFALLVSGRWVNVAFLVCAAFMLVSPLSVGVDIPGVFAFKWARVYLSILLIVTGFLVVRQVRLGPASLAFLFFLGFYTIAGVWSDRPNAALSYKGMYAMVVVGAMLLASGVRSLDDLRIGLRVLAVAGVVYALVILAGLAREPGQLLSGRLSVWGWNANRIGHDCAAMLALCFFMGLYDRIKPLKLLGFGLAGFFGFIILATGSRAATGMAFISAVILAAPLFRRPVLLTMLTVAAALLVNTGMKFIASEATERMTEVSFSNRQGVWRGGLELFYENPFIGAGWVYDTGLRATGGTANLHSMYVQTLAETGLIGAGLLALCLLVCGFRSLALLNMLRRYPQATPCAFFAFSLAGATLAHGVGESASIQGTNLNGLLLPFAIGLLDRVPHLIREATGAAYEEDPAYDYDEQSTAYLDYGQDAQPA